MNQFGAIPAYIYNEESRAEQNESDSGLDFGEFPAHQEQPDQSTLSPTKRTALAAPVRAAEAFGGKYGDLLDFAKSGIISAFEGITGKEEPIFRKFVNRDIPGATFPTSENLRGITKELTGEQLEPQSEDEKTLHELFGDIGSLFDPKRQANKWLVPIGQAIAGQGTKKAVEALEGSEGEQGIAKIGATLLIDLATRGNAAKHTGQLYKNAQAVQPKNAIVDFSKGLNRFDDQLSRLEKGFNTPNKAQILSPLRQIYDKAASGGIALDDLIEARRNINELRRQPALRELAKSDKKLVRAGLNEIDHSLNEAINDYGKQHAPEWLKAYRTANESARGLAASEEIKDFVKNNVKNPLLAGPAGILFGIGSAFPFGTASAIGATLATAQTAMLTQRVMQNPTLRKYYLEVVSESLAGNAAAANRAFKNLNEGVEKVQHSEYLKSKGKGRKFTPFIAG
jgi:hypothetical protein